MLASVRALLAGIIDYAGLFPPAKLPLDQSLRNYLRYRTEPESWMLGRFICPAARLGELSTFRDEIVAQPQPLTISALACGGKHGREFLDGVRDDLGDIAKARAAFGDHILIDVYEARLPNLFDADQRNQLYALIGTTAFLLDRDGPEALTPFFEPPSAAPEAVKATLDLLAADRVSPEAARRQRIRPAGLKLRCGGVEAAAFPSPEQVALAIAYARERGVPMKFTAGLHHPIRRFDAGVNATTHGFVNVFAAGALGHVCSLKASTVKQIVEAKSFAQFHVDDTCLGWNNLLALASQIAVARREFVTSFGSCSFDEPRDDLRELGLLP